MVLTIVFWIACIFIAWGVGRGVIDTIRAIASIVRRT